MSQFFERVGTDMPPSVYPGGHFLHPELRETHGFTAQKYALSDGTYWGAPGTSDALEPAFYTVHLCRNRGVLLAKTKTVSDELLRLPDPVCDMLLAEFITFWDSVPRLVARGLLAKRGLLLWGPPGSGKTSALNIMAAHMIKELHGVAILVGEPGTTVAGLQLFRKVEPDRPVILIYEDIDALTQQYGEAPFLAMLDGEMQISGVVNVATTNYPERLDPRFVDRPGRFDRITECPMPGADARRAYLAAKAPEADATRREKWVKATEGLSLGHLRELIVAHIGLGEDDAAVIARLNEMHARRPVSDQAGGRRVGFGREFPG
jgi:energy-coupling factor transporter ATP-binding protein EcfA2